MLCKTDSQTLIPSTAPVDSFSLLRNQVLAGGRLAQVKVLQESIARFGLLSPIVAIRREGRLFVVDGRKRLAALRRLAFQGRLPRSLKSIPYLIARGDGEPSRRTALLTSNPELFRAVRSRFTSGMAIDAIAQDFHISRQCVRDVLSLSRLDDRLRALFFARRIDFAQARAYASIPETMRQRVIAAKLGLDATAEAVLDAARTGLDDRAGARPDAVNAA